MDHQFYMKVGIILAKEALKKQQVPIAAVVVCNNEILAQAYNDTDGSPIGHAELLAFSKIKHPERCTLYVTVEPCIMCLHALDLLGVKRIVFGACNQRFGGMSVLKQSRQINIIGGVLQQEAVDLLQNFFEQSNNKFGV